jgi:DNA-binding XRE family transcriptional regulator
VVHNEGDLEPIVLEVCQGQVTRADVDVERFVKSLGRRLDVDRGKRFEFVTVAPDDEAVLAILGDGQAVLLKRPLATQDDGTEVVAIVLSDDAASATLELASGATMELDVATVAPAHLNGANGAIPIDGARLGARLRELRLSAGLTQAELARRTGIHRPNIARVEAGRHTPSLETLARLATAIGVPTTRVLATD